MIAQNPTLGTCPHCEATITTRHVLIEYESSTGQTAYAECPDCEAVIHPSVE